MGMTLRQENSVFVLILLACFAAGVVAGVTFTWGFILVYSIVIGLSAVVSLITSSNLPGALRGSLTIGAFLFLMTSWCSFWVSLAGVFRK